MSGVDYEFMARFAQQGGTIYFAVIFLAGCVYAFWPKKRDEFRKAAQAPLQNDENDHVQA